MDKIRKIEYLSELQRQKKQLLEEINLVNKKMEEEVSTCSHISVDLGYCGCFPYTTDKYRCLICGKGKNGYFYEPKYVIHAENYLTHLNIKDEIECDKKFNIIQSLASGIIKNNSGLSKEELVNTLNNLIQEQINNPEYNKEMEKLISLFNGIINSGEYTMLVESIDDENVLEYGIIGKKMEKVKFDNINGEKLFEFIYKGICEVAPNSIVNFMNVDAFGNMHSTVIIELNEKVNAIITNSNHKYDSFISMLEDTMKDSEEIVQENNNGRSIVLKKYIKPIK